MQFRQLIALAAAAASFPLSAADSVPPNPAQHVGGGQNASGEHTSTVHSWEMPAITVEGQRSQLRE